MGRQRATIDRRALLAAPLIVPLFIANAALIGVQIGNMLSPDGGADWRLFEEAVRRFGAGSGEYSPAGDYAFLWSPVAAWLMTPVIAVGILPWRLLHIAAALTLPDRRMTVACFALWPFWFDLDLGNVMTFVLWFAAWGLRGKRWAMIGFLALMLMIPRPLMIPLAMWFLYREPAIRVPFIALFGVHGALVVMSGLALQWIGVSQAIPEQIGSIFNFAPSRVIGMVWVPIGLTMGVGAWLSGRPAVACLLVSPYALPYYFLIALADIGHQRPGSRFRTIGQVLRRTTRP